MNALLAGWAAGYIMAVASTAALVFLVVRLSMAGAWLDRWVASEVPRPLLAVPISLGATFAWTMIGLLLASFYEVAEFEAKPGALGSPSLPFTLIIVVLAFLPLPPLLLLARRYAWLWGALSVLFAALFGWMMPVLAAR